MGPKVSILVITHDKRAHLSGVLAVLASTAFPSSDFEVVVVDDGSSDGTLEFLQELRPGYAFRFVRQPQAGRAAARNAAAKLARGRLLVILDDDCLLRPESLAALWHAHEADPGALLVSTVRHVAIEHVRGVLEGIRLGSGVDWDALAGLAPVDSEYMLAGLAREILQEGIERFAVPWLAAPGTAVSIPAEAFHRLGGYDESFVKYGMEDFDLALRFDDAGGRFRGVADSVLYHLDHGHDSARLFKESTLSTRVFYDKYRDRAEVGEFVRFLCGGVSFRDFNNSVAARRGMPPIDRLDGRFSPYGMVRYRGRQHEAGRVAEQGSGGDPAAEYRLRFLLGKIGRDMDAGDDGGGTPSPLPRLDELPAGRLLVLAPHMDDEVIGCGGLVFLASRSGAEVTVVYLTDGASRNLSPEAGDRMRQARRGESECAARLLGVGRRIYLDIPERGLADAASDPSALANILQEVAPDTVLVPSDREHHPDHRTVHAWLRRAIAASGLRPVVYSYEVSGCCRPNQVLVLDPPTWERKQEALRAYRSQLDVLDYARLMEFTARRRGLRSGAGDARGEAYRRLAADEMEWTVAC